MLAETVQKEAISQLYDDFLVQVPAWLVDVNSGSSPPAIAISQVAGRTSGGWLRASTRGVANDFRAIATPTIVELLPGSPVKAYVSMLIAEAAANSSSWYFGLVDATTAGFLQMNGSPPSSYSGCVIWKPRGSSTIRFETARGTAKAGLIDAGKFVSGVPFTLSIQFDPADGVGGILRGLVNDQFVDSYGTALRPPTPPLQLAGLPLLCMSAGILASTSAAETLQLDYWGIESYRPG